MTALAATPRNGELGFWMAGLADSRQTYPRFTGQDSVDLAIIGAGYTGLWAAYFAKKLEPSLKVAVFEAEQIGYGASGRRLALGDAPGKPGHVRPRVRRRAGREPGLAAGVCRRR